MVIFVFYCYTANHHKFSSLKQHWYISSKFCPSEVWTQDDWFLLRVSPGWNQGGGWASSHLEARIKEESDSRLTFLAESRSSWAEVPAFLLLTRSCSQLLNTAHILSPSDHFLSSKPAVKNWALYIKSLTLWNSQSCSVSLTSLTWLHLAHW